MRLVHLSDLHLGFRAFRRVERGWNLRERDLAAAFRHAVQEIGDLRPDVVLVTGDLFDRPDPPSTAFLTLFRGMDALRRSLPRVPILVIAGERDTPGNPADPGPVAALDSLPGLEAAAGAARAVRFRKAGVHALLVPHRAVLRPPFPDLRPDPEARWNLLLIRGELSGDPRGAEVDASEWDYVALGGDHVAANPRPGVWIAGSLERVGWDPWQEATEEKGFVVYDLEAGTGEVHPVPARPVVDLAPIRTTPTDPEAGTRRLRDVLKGIPGGIQGRILRVRLRGDLLSPEEGAAPGLLAAVRARTAHVEFLLLGEGDEDRVGGPEAPRPMPAVPIRLGEGITAVTAREALVRRRAAAELGSAPLGNGDGVPAGPLAALAWAGHPDDPGRTLREGVPLLAAVGGGPSRGVDGSPEPGAGGSDAPDPAAESDLRVLEQELGRVRADAMEAAGEMEAGNLEWARSRQDAESRLLVYRDRARELRARLRELERDGERSPCPTCGRPVGDGFDALLRTLKEEWEAVVQDGRWWKRRREQMEQKPEELRLLEGVALQLHARLESLSEEVERTRERRRWETREGPALPPGPEASESWAGTPESRRILRRLLRRGGSLLHGLTEGSAGGVFWDEGRLRIQGWDGGLRPPLTEEGKVLGFALHLALWIEARSSGSAPGAVLFREFAGDGDEELAARSLALAARTLPPTVPGVMVLPPGAVERVPEAIATLWEVEEGPGGLRYRMRPAGRPRIRLV